MNSGCKALESTRPRPAGTGVPWPVALVYSRRSRREAPRFHVDRTAEASR